MMGRGGGGGGSDRGLYFILKIIPPSDFVFPKIPYDFSIPKKPPIPAVNCAYVIAVIELMKSTIPKIVPASFIDPKTYLLEKISDPKKSLGPPSHPPVKYVSGAPGIKALLKLLKS